MARRVGGAKLAPVKRPAAKRSAAGPASVPLALDELDRLTARARFVAAVEEGLDDPERGRVVSDEELGRRLDARFGALRKKG